MHTSMGYKTKAEDLCQIAQCWGKFLPSGFSSKQQELKSGDFISSHMSHIQLPMQISGPKGPRHTHANFWTHPSFL